uniref:Uncharacterized protein n=1 Tax=Arundo donax TaxID=35708 RepID=A0A0A8Y7Q0_ARUDO
MPQKATWKISKVCNKRLTCSSPFHPSLELVILYLI